MPIVNPIAAPVIFFRWLIRIACPFLPSKTRPSSILGIDMNQRTEERIWHSAYAEPARPGPEIASHGSRAHDKAKFCGRCNCDTGRRRAGKRANLRQPARKDGLRREVGTTTGRVSIEIGRASCRERV